MTDLGGDKSFSKKKYHETLKDWFNISDVGV